MLREENGKIPPLKGLTGIHLRIHCAATTDDQEGGHNEADSIIIDNFNRALAEIAVNVARRRLKESEDDVEN